MTTDMRTVETSSGVSECPVIILEHICWDFQDSTTPASPVLLSSSLTRWWSVRFTIFSKKMSLPYNWVRPYAERMAWYLGERRCLKTLQDILNLLRPHYSICPSLWDNENHLHDDGKVDNVWSIGVPHTCGIVKMSSYGGWFLRDFIHIVNPLPTTIGTTMNPTGFAEPEGWRKSRWQPLLRYLLRFEL